MRESGVEAERVDGISPLQHVDENDSEVDDRHQAEAAEGHAFQDSEEWAAHVASVNATEAQAQTGNDSEAKLALGWRLGNGNLNLVRNCLPEHVHELYDDL